MTGLSVPRAALGPPGPQLGAGGQAKVYLVPGFSLPDVDGPVVFKHYRTGHRPPGGLSALVLRRLKMDQRARTRLDARTAWPVRTVEEGDEVCGVLMPLIPGDFFRTRSLPSGEEDRSLCEWQHLFVDPARSKRFGMPTPNLRTRVLLCRDFASALHLLHTNGFVVGDINAKNAVFRLNARPSVMLVDCDAIRVKGSAAVVAQLNAPDWDPPERSLSQTTDLYKLGLLILRTLCPGNGASLYRNPVRVRAVLDARGLDLLTRALGTKPHLRPTAQEWGHYLDEVLGTGVQAPRAPSAPDPVITSTSGWARDPVTKRWVQLGPDATR